MDQVPPPVNVSRRAALKKQDGCCYYCGSPMWEKNRNSFAKRYSISAEKVSKFQCTAEHLRARCDGGKDWPKNIVAACLSCNAGRHKGKKIAPSPEEYREVIRKQRRKDAQVTSRSKQRKPARTCSAGKGQQA